MTDRPGFEQIVRDHGAMIRRIAASHEARPQLAEELVQEIHLAVWKALPAFRGGASLRTFVARIATNRAVTHVAQAMRLPPSGELSDQMAAPEIGPEGAAIARDRQARLMAAVRRLPMAYRQAALLTLEGMTPNEIADVLGISSNAVAIRLTRAKELLRLSMGEEP